MGHVYSLLILPMLYLFFYLSLNLYQLEFSQDSKASIKTWQGGIREPEKWSLTTLPKAQFVACWKSQDAK